MKVSVIIPCYNVEKYLERCMQSILYQTLKDIEIILVDDESPDNVPFMCDEYARKDNRIKVIHKKNGGLGFARNSGLDNATGEYIAFVDSDDFVDLNMYETLYKKAKQEDADIVYCNCAFYTDKDNIKPRYDVNEETIFSGRKKVDEFLLDLIGPKPHEKHDVKYMMSVWHGIYRKSIFNNNNIRFVSERDLISEDIVFDIEYLSKCDKIIYTPNVFYYYCLNDSSLTRKVDVTRYTREKKLLKHIESQLECIFKREEYLLHFQRQQILRLRISINKAKQNESNITIKDILNDKYWETLLKTYPYQKMDIKHLLYFLCLKRKYSNILIHL